MLVGPREQDLALADHLDHRALLHGILVRNASIVQQTGSVDGPLLGVSAQLLLLEGLAGDSVWRVPGLNAKRKVHSSSINVLILQLVVRSFRRTCCLVV